MALSAQWFIPQFRPVANHAGSLLFDVSPALLARTSAALLGRLTGDHCEAVRVGGAKGCYTIIRTDPTGKRVVQS
jgi:hypothetical protein